MSRLDPPASTTSPSRRFEDVLPCTVRDWLNSRRLDEDHFEEYRQRMSRHRLDVFRSAVGLPCLLVALTGASLAAERPLPRLIADHGRHALLVDDAPYLVLGAQANNSSGWPAVLPEVWPAMEFIHANTAEIPVYWEQFEPEPGKYDPSAVDALLAGARSHHLHLILLWFGTWKNGSQHYMPAWMKLQPERYFHVVDAAGRPLDSPSPFAADSLAADTRAFTALMAHLRAADPERTVVMVQVENEAGTWGTLRDHSPEANRLFNGAVPPDVLTAMGVAAPASASPTWEQAFGAEAEVFFHAWSVARYIGHVAAAGKAVYPLPLFANAALRAILTPGAPGTYQAGGPLDNVIPIWKVCAPALDMVCPDNYETNPAAYLKFCELYHRDDNALYLPETGGSPRLLFYALGQQAIGFSPFGIDFTRTHEFPDVARPPEDRLPPWALTGTREFAAPFVPLYRLLAPMGRTIARLNFEGRIQAVAEQAGRITDDLHFGPWDATIAYGVWARNGHPAGNPQPLGGALVAQLAENQFLVAGFYCRADFRPLASGRHRQFLSVEEGTFVNDTFTFRRILNGDQTDGGLDFSSEPLVLRVSLATY